MATLSWNLLATSLGLKNKIMQDPKLTPGKFDDVLEAAECFSNRMALVFKHAKDNYVDPDGTFQDIKFYEVQKWQPIVSFIASSAQGIAEDCFGKDVSPEIKSYALRVVMTFLGIKIDNPAALDFLSRITGR